MSKGMWYMLFGTIAFAMMNAVVKWLDGFNAFEIVFFRSVVALLICLSLVQKKKLKLVTPHTGLLVLRSVVGVISMSAFFIAIHKIPFGTVVSIRYISPLLATIMAVYLFQEKVKPIQWFYFILAVVGVVLMKGFDVRVSVAGLSIALFSAVGTSLVFIVLRKIGQRVETLVIVTYFMIFGTVTGGLIGSFYWRQPEGWEWVALISIGVFGFAGQFFMTKAMQSEEVSKVVPIKYAEAVLAIAIGYFVFKEGYGSGAFLGICLVIGSTLLNVFSKKRTG